MSSINYIKNMLLELFKEKINLISIYILNNLKIFIITHVKPKKKKLDRFPYFKFSTLVHKDQFTYFNSCTHNLNGLYLRKCTYVVISDSYPPIYSRYALFKNQTDSKNPYKTPSFKSTISILFLLLKISKPC